MIKQNIVFTKVSLALISSVILITSCTNSSVNISNNSDTTTNAILIDDKTPANAKVIKETITTILKGSLIPLPNFNIKTENATINSVTLESEISLTLSEGSHIVVSNLSDILKGTLSKTIDNDLKIVIPKDTKVKISKGAILKSKTSLKNLTLPKEVSLKDEFTLIVNEDMFITLPVSIKVTIPKGTEVASLENQTIIPSPTATPDTGSGSNLASPTSSPNSTTVQNPTHVIASNPQPIPTSTTQAVTPVSVKINRVPEGNIVIGNSFSLMATVTMSDGSTNTSNIAWSSSNSALGAVDSNGLFTAGSTQGTVTITATVGSLKTSVPISVIYPQSNTNTTPQISGLIAYFPFNGNVNDESGNNVTATITGATLTTDRFGSPNSAYNFNGTSNYITVNLDINPTALPAMTMTAWVRSTIVPNGNYTSNVISHDNGGYDRSMGIDYRGGGVGWSAFTGAGVLGFSTVSQNTWTFLATRYDQNNQTVDLFVNGTKYSQTNVTAGSGNTFFRIGNNPCCGLYFDGDIDQVRIYNRALSDSEIGTIKNILP